MTLTAFLGALLIGVALGLLGSGGVLIVPTLIYGTDVTIKVAVPYSLFIVTAIAGLSTLRELKSPHLKIKNALPFAAMGIVGSYGSARYLSPLLSETALLSIFILLVLAISLLMIHKALRPSPQKHFLPTHGFGLPLMGLFCGSLSGTLGIGGGFVIVPVLTLLAGFSMPAAVATSLFVITVNGLGGVLGYLGHTQWDYTILALFTFFGLLGSWYGSTWRNRLSEKTLKLSFAFLLQLLSLFLLYDKLWKS